MSELKFKFEDSQQYQLDAITAMTDIFTGAERADPVFAVVKGIVDVGAFPGVAMRRFVHCASCRHLAQQAFQQASMAAATRHSIRQPKPRLIKRWLSSKVSC